jgi:hypothetical protein
MTRPRGHILGSVAATLALSDWERRTAVGGAVVDEVEDDAEWCAGMGIADETNEEEM